MLYGLYYYVTIETTSKCLQLKWNLPWSQSMPEVFLEIFSEKERASPRVTSWPCRLHENEIRGQGNQRVFSLLATSRLALSLPNKNFKKNLWDQGKWNHESKGFTSLMNVSFSLYPHEPASTWCHWEESVFTTISLTPRTGFDTCTIKCSDFRLETTNSRSSLIDACDVLEKHAIYQLWLDD